jgi:hypothetical protein
VRENMTTGQWTGGRVCWLLAGNAVDYLVNAESFVSYTSGAFAVGADLNQWYTSGSNVAFLGPKATWKAATNVDLEAGVGFPVWQDAAYGQENSCTVTLGLGIKF